MKMGLTCRTDGHKILCLYSVLYSIIIIIGGVNAAMSRPHQTLSISAPHMYYTCPEGATVTMECVQRGTALHPTDVLKHRWFFTAHSDQNCHDHQIPRHDLNHDKHSWPPGVHPEYGKDKISLVVENVTRQDQGRYCCMIYDFQDDKKHVLQWSHSSMVLHVTPRKNGSQDCTVWDPQPAQASVPVALVIVPTILALLALPLILVLVYKQRQNAQSNRRAHELVRMDSEAQGHDNPVYLRGSPQLKVRTVSQIMTRQSSETGRHLLSEPGTPLSPPYHGEVFFPTHETIAESPDLLQV
ncbi:V-type immunoglobulin domain-containing suppressor of T-cell activation [Thalassophryne amazonica]|uniref:V-type immunoglobulin domain-containing suppressor of T-cell activation n=1 Tax=Thalassophryne amazonica TaxID=390379 RepID=UPI001470D825|nr:V-type immunoglobulin domain-containing suppressor of T-cell activation [Thalassophryne amazonica]